MSDRKAIFLEQPLPPLRWLMKDGWSPGLAAVPGQDTVTSSGVVYRPDSTFPMNPAPQVQLPHTDLVGAYPVVSFFGN